MRAPKRIVKWEMDSQGNGSVSEMQRISLLSMLHHVKTGACHLRRRRCLLDPVLAAIIAKQVIVLSPAVWALLPQWPLLPTLLDKIDENIQCGQRATKFCEHNGELTPVMGGVDKRLHEGLPLRKV